MRDTGAGFNSDTNKISIIFDETKFKTFELKNKDDVAQDIVEELVKII
jgi:phosphopantothenoylcysteine decarboxylase/phosphopantothenate--cysteine ligase